MSRQQQPWRPGQKKLGWKTWTAIGAGTLVAAIIVGVNAETTPVTATSTSPSTTTTTTLTIDASVLADASTPASSAAPVQQTASYDALASLARLPVKGRAPTTGYARELFGQSWSDDVSVAGGHNGCDTRIIWTI
ncbi:hypothetical protein [Nocardia cyriacigeorgica]|uniref:hypothetical protein n=1 Tax=Nocardia cyriacigeorgica TaxID=135487 RepID=UPI003D77B38C